MSAAALVAALDEAKDLAARGEPVPEAVTDLVLRILAEASDTPAVLAALRGAPDGRALLRITDGARAIEFQAGDGRLFAEAAEPKGKGPKVDAVAATVGPGLIGCLLVGANYARGLALAAGLPFIGVNHLEGHVYANWLFETEDVLPEPEIPAVVLVVSGAHSDLVLMEAHRRFRLLGRTIDDAAGEAFDKVARLLGLRFPGGPEIEKAARDGDPNAFALPKAWLADRYDFSFSGLKTAVLRLVRSLEEKGPLPVGDVAASFQKAIVEALAEKTARAAAEHGVRSVMLGGGVAANGALRAQIARRIGVPLHVPPPRLCTDNGAMVGAAAFFSLRHRGAEMPAGVRSNLPLA